jgi:hypothetical protein
MRRSIAVVLVVVVWALAPGTVRAQNAAPWYDAAALLDHVRPSQREGLALRLGVDRLEDLPFYDLHLAIDDRLRGFGLREVVYVTNDARSAMREVVLRVFANAVGPAGAPPPVSLLAGECLDGVRCTVEHSAPSVIRVRPARPLRPGERLRIQLDLQGRLQVIDASRLTMSAQGLESLAGLMAEGAPGAGDYGLLAQGDGIASLANFFAVLARREGALWIVDDGGTLGDLGTDAMAHVRARIVAPRDVQVVASGAEVRSLPVRDPPGREPRREVTVHAALVRDFAVIASRGFESAARDVGGVTVRSWYLSADREPGRRVLATAASALEVFQRRFGQYPYTELDVVEAPLVGGAGGVEFSGLVTVACMFYRPPGEGDLLGLLSSLGSLVGLGGDGAGGAAAIQDAMLEFVTAHEVAHQWWHGIVGSDSRRHPWVDESLAQFSAMLWVEERYGAARAQQEGDRQVAMNYRAMRMMGIPDAAVDRPTSSFRSAIEYAGLVYGKGPYLYRALRTELGDTAFFAGLRAYVERWRYQIAPARGPIDALATGARASRVRALARRWLDETHGDEDLGGGDALAMLGAMLPPELQDQLRDPQLQAMMRRLMQQMLGSQRRPGGGGLGLGGGMAGGDEAQMMRALEQMLGELPVDSSP